MIVDESTLLLGIETSCDETAAALVMGGSDVVSSVVSTQVELHAEFGGRLAAKMRSHLRSLHAPNPNRDELEGLVIDGWLALRRCAAAWDPDGGALPWNWAGHRMRRVASDWVGQYADGLDEATLRHPAAGRATPATAGGRDEAALTDLLEDLAERNADRQHLDVGQASADEQLLEILGVITT